MVIICGTIVTSSSFHTSYITAPQSIEAVSASQKSFSCALELYNLKNEKKISLLLPVVSELLDDYQIDPLFFNHPERNLFLLAIASQWIKKSNMYEKNALLNTLKLVATGVDTSHHYTSLSGYVRKLSLNKSEAGLLYDPQAYTNTHCSYHCSLKTFLENNYDKEQTQRVQMLVEDWSDHSLLHHVRSFLGVTEKTEKKFQIIVLKQTYQELTHGAIGYAACYTTALGVPTIVLASNFETGMLEHEYAHSQSKGVWRWYQLLLFRGITEALTESCVSVPTSYKLQREVLTHFLKKNPELQETIYEAYKGNEHARHEIFSHIIHKYGFEGFLHFARLAPVDNPRMSGNIGSSIFIKPDRVMSIFA